MPDWLGKGEKTFWALREEGLMLGPSEGRVREEILVNQSSPIPVAVVSDL